MASLPESVKIGPYMYAVTECDRIADVDSRFGECDFINQSIRLAQEIPAQRKRVTIIHEVLHAMSELSGIAQTIDDTVLEDMITRLSPAIAELLRENPELIAYVTEEGK